MPTQPSRDSKQAEKDYLRRSGGGNWELLKPFPAPGQSGTDEHTQHLLDFAVCLRVLAPKPADHILDLGAGSCWVSDWLRKFHFRTVAVDIAFDMVHLGKIRMGSANGLTVGDMEALPFQSGSFDKACCLNAFHHVPDAAKALREIRRVLKPDGVVFFSEPGAGHAANPASVSATKNYGVLEQEILIHQFMDTCLAAGFADVRLHAIAQVLPLFVLDRDEWQRWTRYSGSQRPFRAMEKMWRAALELFGVGKKDILFEEAFAIRLARELKPVIESHPVITAHCSPFVRPDRLIEHAAIELLDAPTRLEASSTIVMKVRVKNVGSTTWNERAGDVRLGIQLLHADGSVMDRDYVRHGLNAAISPGQACQLEVPVAVPATAGSYQLKFDLVREGVRWFEAGGSEPRVHPVEIIGL